MRWFQHLSGERGLDAFDLEDIMYDDLSSENRIIVGIDDQMRGRCLSEQRAGIPRQMLAARIERFCRLEKEG